MGKFTYKQDDEVELNVHSPGFLELGLTKGSIGKVVNASIGEVLFTCPNGNSARILMSDSELQRKVDKLEFYAKVRKKLNKPGAAVRCNGDTVEICGIPPGTTVFEARYDTWYFVGKVSDFK